MGEQPLPRHGACCLASINLSEFVSQPYTDRAYFKTSDFVNAVRVGVKTLDKLIDENYYRHPLKEQQEMSYNYRNIGLGIFGYATMLMKLGLEYGSDEAIAFTDQIMSLMFRAAIIKSNELAKELGVFPKYKDCVWDSDIIKKHFPQSEIDTMREYGLRNCSLLSIAPTGSIATILGESGGAEPEYALSFTRRTVGMTNNEDAYYKVFCKAAREYMAINNCTEDQLPSYFVASSNIPWQNRVKTQAVMQEHVDTAISSTVNLPNETTKEDIEQLYLMAWKQGLKGITIFRDGCKRIPILSTNNSAKEASDHVSSHATPDELPRGYIVDATDDVIGKKRKINSGCGALHCTAFFDPITGDLMETYLSKGSTGGCQNFMIGLSRMISLAARAGCSVHAIVDQLNSCGVCPSYAVRRATKHDTSDGSCCPMAVGKALLSMWKEMQNELIDEDEEANECNQVNTNKEKPLVSNTPVPQKDEQHAICPECGASIIHEGGCVQCKNCGWSKCN